jgi:predicted  nucleic acid-binding Zn-ribbon protein
MSQIDRLFRLQQIDDEITQKKQRFGEILRLQKESKELGAARLRAKSAAAELQKCRTQQQDLNLELTSLNNKTKQSENRLYSGLVKNPKELADLQSGIESLKRQRATLEDEVLEAMILFEDAEEENNEASSELAEIEETWNASQAHLKGEQSNLVQRINELNQVRKGHTESIPANLMAAYEHVTKRGQAPAVAELKNNRCRACQVTVPATLVKGADEGKLVYCDNCGRILSPV